MAEGQEAGSDFSRLTRRYRVSGLVQGVGFRYFVLRQAERIGVDGWVRNTASGEVEVRASGSADQLAGLEQSLWKGPRFSRVANVEILEGGDEWGPVTGFEVID
jgi:acylphosphatase